MKVLTLLLVLLLVPVGCSPAPSPPPGGDDCNAACQHLGEGGLHCAAFGPTPAGVPCETWLCQSHGVKSVCLVRATSCEQADSYQTSGCSDR